jgi:hypothetical protein
MQEQERIADQVFECDINDVAGPRQPRMGVTHPPLRLKAPRPQPFVSKGEGSFSR